MDTEKTISPSKPDFVLTLGLCLLVIFTKYIFVAIYKERQKGKAKKNYSNLTELHDKPDMSSDNNTDEMYVDVPTSSAYELTPLRRWSNIQRNDMENILPFLMAVVVYHTSNTTDHFVMVVLSVVFAYTRVIHTVMYSKAIQPWRAVAYIFGLASTVIISLWGLASTYSNPDPHSEYQLGFQWIFLLLITKIYCVHLLTVIARFKTGNFASPEDRRPTIVIERDESQLVERYLRIANNDLENILPFFMVIFLWQEYTSETRSHTVNLFSICLASIFCTLNILNTLFHIFALQPWRFISYVIANTITTVMYLWCILYLSLYDSTPFFPIRMIVAVVWSYLSVKSIFVGGLVVWIRRKAKGGLFSVQEEEEGEVSLLSQHEDYEHVSKVKVERLLSCHHRELQFLVPLAISTVLLIAYGTTITTPAFPSEETGPIAIGQWDLWVLSLTFFMIAIVRTFHTFFYVQEVVKVGPSWKFSLFVVGIICLVLQFYWIFYRVCNIVFLIS